MSGGTSQCSRNINIAEFPMTSLRISSLDTKREDFTAQHVTLSQASRPSTSSAIGAFAGNLINKLKKGT